MTLKFMKNNNLSSATASSPEKMLNPLATNLRAQNLPTLATGARNGIAMGTTPTRGIKRGRESSEEENSSDDEHGQRRSGGGRRRLASDRRLKQTKRLRTGDHKWNTYHQKAPRRENSSDEDEEDEEETMMPSPVKRTGLNIGALSLTPPAPVSSEYASMNGLLKMLHLNRGGPQSWDKRTTSNTKGVEKLSHSTLLPQESIPATSQRTDEGEIVDETEKDAVTSIYEEANRALGRLMLDRRRPAQPLKSSSTDGEDYSDEE